jgi:2'-5' RNA ligase
MRIFVALDVGEQVHERIGRFVEAVRSFEPNVRWVTAESLHVTLKFIGEAPNDTVKRIEAALREIRGRSFSLSFGGYGFFPNPSAARIFWVGIKSQAGLVQLASTVEKYLAATGIREETRSFSPHLTLARAPGGSGAPGWRKGDRKNRLFSRLRERLEQVPAPEFGTVSVQEFFLYQSQLSSKGAKYTKIARFELRSPDQ